MFGKMLKIMLKKKILIILIILNFLWKFSKFFSNFTLIFSLNILPQCRGLLSPKGQFNNTPMMVQFFETPKRGKLFKFLNH